MKKTPLYDNHVRQGAKMTDFSGYEMPMQFSRIQEEHMAVRTHAGVFDVSHMGEFIVEGTGALPLLERLTTNNVADLKVGRAQYTLMTNPGGGIIDDLIIYRLEEEQYMLVVNAGNIEKDWNWIIENKSYTSVTRNISTETGLIALQGPRSIEILQPLTSVDLKTISSYHFKRDIVAQIDDILISATGYTGSGGFELYVPHEHAVDLWEAILQSGEPHGLKRAGLGARNTLRLEMGYCLYGQDIDEQTTPWEAGLGWITKMNKPSFVGQEKLAKQKSKGVVERLKCFELNDKRVPRSGYTIHNMDKKKIGDVRSGTFSPCLQKPIGMGYIRSNLLGDSNQVLISNGKKYFEGNIVKPPFVNVKDYVS